MPHHKLVYRIFNLAALLSILFNFIQPVLVAYAQPEVTSAPSLAAPLAPSELAKNWPKVQAAERQLPVPFLDPISLALEQALGGVIEADLVGGSPTRLEPLTSQPAPAAKLPLSGVSLPTTPDPLVQNNLALPQPGSVSEPSTNISQPTDPLTNLNPNLPTPSNLQTLADIVKADETETQNNKETSLNSVPATETPTKEPQLEEKQNNEDLISATDKATFIPASITPSTVPSINLTKLPETPAGPKIQSPGETQTFLTPLTNSLLVSITTVGLTPSVLTTTAGVTVTWFNSTDQIQLLRGQSSIQEIYLPLVVKNLGITSHNQSEPMVSPDSWAEPFAADEWGQDIPPGDTFSRAFTQPGNYPYYLANSPTLTGLIVIQASCSSPAVGEGASPDAQLRMQAVWLPAYGCPAAGDYAYKIATLNGKDYYAQEFTAGTQTGAIVDNPVLGQAFFLPTNVWTPYEPKADELGGPLSQQPSAPKHFIDPSHNFREQEIWYFEYGFVSKNIDTNVWEAYPYFPKFSQGQFSWSQDPASGKYRLELTTDFDPAPPADGVTNPPPTPAATAQVRMVIEDDLTGIITKTSTANLSQGTGQTIPASGYDYYPTQTLKVFIEANRGDLIGYSRCNYYDPEPTNKRYYYLIPSLTPPSFGYDCVGNGVQDTTPPTIEILQVYATDNKDLSPLGATILARITDDFGIANQAATISAGTVVTPLVLYPSAQHGPDVYAATFEDVPEKTLVTFTIVATDNSGLSASVITQTWPADWQVLDLRTCDPSSCGRSYATTDGNPVLTFSGDKAETIPLLYVPGPGEADIDVSITYHSANIRTGLFGAAIASSLETHLVSLYNPLVNGVEVVLGDGGRIRFEDNGNGTFTAASPGSDDTLIKQGSGYLFTTYDQKSYHFDDKGRLIEQLDRNGNAITYGYSGNQLTSLTTGGRTVSLTYQGDYVKTLQIGAKVVTLTYDGDKLVDIEDPEKGHWVLEYDSHKIGEIIDERGEDFAYTAYNHYLIQVTTPEGRIKNKQSYDSEGRVTSQTSSAKGKLSFTYVENSDGSRETHIADAYTEVESHYYNALGQLWKKKDREGKEEFYFYNADFHLERKVDFNGETWEYKRDSSGNIIEIFGSEAFHEEMKYNKFNFITYRKDADSYEWFFEYDGRGNLTKITQPDASFSEIIYDGRGLPTDVYDFNRNHTVNEYEALTGDLLRTWDGENSLTMTKFEEFKYDPYGRLQQNIRPMGGVWDYIYDLNDNLKEVKGPEGYQAEFIYDRDNLLTDQKDADGFWKRYKYDARGRLEEFRNGEDEPTFYRYKEMNELKEVENARGAITVYRYDKNYRVVQVDMPENVTLKYSYDGLGNILFATDGEGRVTAYDYNGLNRLVKLTQNFKAGSISNADTNVVTEYRYDGRGNLTKLINPLLDEIEHHYNSVGRLDWLENEENEHTTYSYDNNGNLTRIEYPEHNTVETEYNGRNQLRLSRDGEGFETEFRYDANSNLEMVIAPDKVTRRFEYNLLDQAIKVFENYVPSSPINADAETNVMTEYGYSLAGDLKKITNPQNFVFTFDYDKAHRRIKEINPAGEIIYTYDDVGNLTETLDANKHPWQTKYDLLNRPTDSINPETHIVHLDYDRANNVTVITDGRENPTRTEYDALNRPKMVLDRMDFQIDYVYDAAGNLRQLTDGNRHTTDFEYDRAHRLKVRIDAEKFRTEYEYDKNGRLTLKRIPFPNLAQTIVEHYNYDGRNLLKRATNGEDEVTQYFYNNVGLQETKIDPDGVQTRYEYDSLRRLNRVIMNYDGSSTLAADRNVAYVYRYDRTGNLESLLDANGHETTFSYDGMNRLIREVDANTNTWDYEYDPVGNRTARIDALHQRTDYTYYDDNQLKRIDYRANNTFVEYTYDKNNNRLSMADHLGLTRWEYDKLDRVTDVTDPFDRHLGYGYDAVNRTSLTYPDGRTVSYGYYLNDWLKTVTDPESNVTGYDRDPAGRVTHITNPNSTVSDLAYDRANRLLTLRNCQVGGAGKVNSAFSYTYDEVGQRTQMVAEYGWRNPPVVTSDYTYDKLRRLIRDANSEGVWTEYSFDRVGNRLTMRTNDNSQSSRPFDEQTLTYSYNAINQLLTVVGDTHPGQASTKREDNTAQALHAFRHEVAAQTGNHISHPAANTLLTMVDNLLADLYSNPASKQAEVTTALAALRNQVIAARDSGAIDSDGIENSLLAKLGQADQANNGASGDLQTTTFTYDANGNRINKEFPGPQGPKIQGTDYVYDPENRLVIAQDYQGNANGNRIDQAITSLAYDGEGRRLVKEFDPKTGGGGTKHTEYVFDGLDPVAEYNIQNNQYDNFYRGDLGRIITMHHFPIGTQGQMFWFHYDGLGSVSGLTKQSGQSTHNYRYGAYGWIEMPPGNFTDPHNHYTFIGQEWDDHLDQYEFFARKYDPVVGVWTTQDVYRGAVRQPRSLHRYGYVGNSPVSLVDLYGFAISETEKERFFSSGNPENYEVYLNTQNEIRFSGPFLPGEYHTLPNKIEIYVNGKLVSPSSLSAVSTEDKRLIATEISANPGDAILIKLYTDVGIIKIECNEVQVRDNTYYELQELKRQQQLYEAKNALQKLEDEQKRLREQAREKRQDAADKLENSAQSGLLGAGGFLVTVGGVSCIPSVGTGCVVAAVGGGIILIGGMFVSVDEASEAGELNQQANDLDQQADDLQNEIDIQRKKVNELENR